MSDAINPTVQAVVSEYAPILQGEHQAAYLASSLSRQFPADVDPARVRGHIEELRRADDAAYRERVGSFHRSVEAGEQVEPPRDDRFFAELPPLVPGSLEDFAVRRQTSHRGSFGLHSVAVQSRLDETPDQVRLRFARERIAAGQPAFEQPPPPEPTTAEKMVSLLKSQADQRASRMGESFGLTPIR